MAQFEPGFLLVHGGMLASADLDRAEAADILIHDGSIIAVGANLGAPPDAKRFDASGRLMHPGLINAHAHAQASFSRSMGDRWSLDLIIAASGFTNAERIQEERYLSALICAAEMVSKGCTAAYDLCLELPIPTREGTDAVAQAYADLGMRALVTPMVADRTFYQSIPGLMQSLPEPLRDRLGADSTMSGDEILAALDDILRNWRWSSQDIRPAVAPSIPLHCTDRFMCGCAHVAREHGARLQSHVAEARFQAIAGQRRYGTSLVHHMDRLGLVGPDFTVAHGVWMDDDDLRLLADKGASVAHDAASNMRLGTGLFRLRRMLDLGVTVGIGTDGASSADSLNMYEAMRAASHMSRLTSPDPQTWASSAEIYRAATQGSANAIGFTDLGELAPGKKADIVFVDLHSINWIPHNRTVIQLVHAEDGTGVRDVMIGGRLVMRDRKLLTIDLERLARQAETVRRRLAEANRENRRAFEEAAPLISSFCTGLTREPFPMPLIEN